MPQIFHRSFNTISKMTIFGSLFLLAGAGALLSVFVRSSYATNQGIVRAQPVPFSHEQHVNGLGIDCRYCHSSVEVSAYAGMPTTKTCMNCHEQIWVGSETLEPVRESFRTGKPLEWSRVHRLSDFVYFNHSAHVNQGVACQSCHGNVNEMPLMWQSGSLLMEWCLDCHRNPAPHLRPRDAVFDTSWTPTMTQSHVDLAAEYGVRSLIHCTTCHR